MQNQRNTVSLSSDFKWTIKGYKVYNCMILFCFDRPLNLMFSEYGKTEQTKSVLSKELSTVYGKLCLSSSDLHSSPNNAQQKT